MHWPDTLTRWFPRRRRRRAGRVEWLHANVSRQREPHPAVKWIVLAAGAVLAITISGLFYRFYFVYNNQFRLTELKIYSGATITEGLVREVLAQNQPRALQRGDRPEYLFGPDITATRRELMRIAPGIRSVTITRRLPHRMEVRIVEREPVGRVGRNDQVVDGEGVVFARNVGVEQLPLLVGVDGVQIRQGTRLEGMGLAAVRLLTAIARPDCALPVMVVDVSRPDYLHLTLRDQRSVKLWWKGMDAVVATDASRQLLEKRLKRLAHTVAIAPQQPMFDYTTEDDNRIYSRSY